MKILITGSHGFVGRNFVRRLLAENHTITGVDSLVEGSGARFFGEWSQTLPNTGVFIEKIMDVRDFFREFPESHFDLVIHLAAVVGGRLTIERNPMAVAEDLSLDSDFWRWVTKTAPNHVISFSSSAAYPVSMQGAHSDGYLLKESDLTYTDELGMPDMTYGWAKMTSEYLGMVVAKQYGIKVASYRPFSGYGSDQDSSYPFRAICERAANREVNEAGQFFVWGSGEQKRDFIHIDDVIECVLKTYDQIEDGSAINISSGYLTSFKELAHMACEEAGWDPEIVGLEAMPEGVFSRGGDTSKQKELGFEPVVPLREGIRRCLQQIEFEKGNQK